MERELDKIERRFKVYSREKEKDKPSETETGSGERGEKVNNSEEERNKTLVNANPPLYYYIGISYNMVYIRALCIP